MCSLKAPGTAYEHSWEGSVLPTYSPLVRTRKNRSVVVGFAVDYMEAEVMVILAQGTGVIDGTFQTRQQVKLSILVGCKAVLRLPVCEQLSVSAMRTQLTAAC